MANCLFGFPNVVDNGSPDGGSWAADLPLDNMLSRVLAKKARSSDLATASTQFTLTLAATKRVRVIGLIAHNLSITARIRVRAALVSDFSTTQYDSGWGSVWPAVYTDDATTGLEWEDDNWWTGQYVPEELTGVNWNLIRIVGEAVQARYLKVEIDDQHNSAGYVEIGRIFAGPAWQPVKNMSYGASLGWETATQIEESLGGAEYFDRRTPYRVMRGSLDWLTTASGLQNAYELMRQAGVDGEILFVFDPDDTVNAVRRQFLGRMRTLSPLEYPYCDITRMPFEIKELL